MKQIFKLLMAAMLFVFVCNVLPASAQSPKSIMYERGYRADIQVGPVWCDEYTLYTLSTSHGYSFGNGLYVGGGIGLYITPAEMGGYKTRYQVPIFAEIKYSFLDWIVSPFVDLKAGGFYDYTLGGTGYVIRPSVGVDIWRFSISAGWDHNRFRWDIGRFGNPGWHVGVSYNF